MRDDDEAGPAVGGIALGRRDDLLTDRLDRDLVIGEGRRDRREDARLPWDIIDGGLKKAFFRNEFDKSMRAEWTLPPKRARENQILIPTL